MFILINVINYVILTKTGDINDADFMIQRGVIYVNGIVENKEYYRLFTSTILHFSPAHLAVNMVSLYCIGNYVESHLGHGKFLALYLIASVGSAVVSFCNIYASGLQTVEAGASGAIYGVVGALLAIVICHRGHFESISAVELIGLIAITLWYGYKTYGVDNPAHIGGLIIGFLLAMLLYRGEEDYDVDAWLE